MGDLGGAKLCERGVAGHGGDQSAGREGDRPGLREGRTDEGEGRKHVVFVLG